MSNNSSDQARKKLYDEYEDSLFRLVMNDVAEQDRSYHLAVHTPRI